MRVKKILAVMCLAGLVAGSLPAGQAGLSAGQGPAGADDKEWKERKAEHFIIYYKNAPDGFIDSVEEMAEYYYQETAANIGYTRYKSWSWDERAKIYIYDNADDYQQVGNHARWSEGVASSRQKVIRTFPAAHGFFDSTLPHELGHIVFREFVGFKAEVPLWFEEGIAMYQEKARRWGADDTVRKAIKDGTFISLEEMTQVKFFDKMETAKIELFYAESASVVNYLIGEWGKQRFINLCRKLQGGGRASPGFNEANGGGGPFEWTFAEVYVNFKDLKHLNKAWVDYLEK